SANPLNFQVGYYTTVAGLGRSPNDVVINGSIYVRNQCFGSNNCTALVNFWRSLSNLTINVTTPNSPALLQVGIGPLGSSLDASDPTAIQDVFFRIGGATAGSATNSLVVNSDNVILDDIWAWRADHGNGIGWTTNTASTGVLSMGTT